MIVKPSNTIQESLFKVLEGRDPAHMHEALCKSSTKH
jgi:hypothetical protein